MPSFRQWAVEPERLADLEEPRGLALDTEAGRAVATIEQNITHTGTDVIVLYAAPPRPSPTGPSGSRSSAIPAGIGI